MCCSGQGKVPTRPFRFAAVAANGAPAWFLKSHNWFARLPPTAMGSNFYDPQLSDSVSRIAKTKLVTHTEMAWTQADDR